MMHAFLNWLSRKRAPTQEAIVRQIILGTAALELPKGEYVYFAPIQGTCGAFALTGNSMPLFKYTVFEKALMEFIEVQVTLCKPDMISFSSRIKSEDKNADGKVVDTKEKYKEPFNELALNLHNYFPLTKVSEEAKYKCEIEPKAPESVDVNTSANWCTPNV
jgi:hypothetical protein